MAKLLINNSDVSQSYGVTLLSGGLDALMEYPKRKAVECNDWYERTGEEADLQTPSYEPRATTLHFFTRSESYASFTRYITNDQAKSWTFTDLDCTYMLRPLELGTVDIYPHFHRFDLRVVEDTPNIGTATPIVPTMARATDFLMDGIPFTDYGVRILEGTTANLLSGSELKEALVVSSEYKTGQRALATSNKYRAKNVTLHCLMQGATKEEFWSNYSRLWAVLSKAGERTIRAGLLNRDYKGYYLQTHTTYLDALGYFWLFDLEVRITDYTP